LYKSAYKLSPAIAGDRSANSFALAHQVRTLDMRASSYNLWPLGYEPVEIETAAGKAAYVGSQRGFAEHAKLLRFRLIDTCATLINNALGG